MGVNFLEKYVSDCLGDVSEDNKRALQDYAQGKYLGKQMKGAEEWQTALAAIVSRIEAARSVWPSVAISESAPQKSGEIGIMPGADVVDTEIEMRLVRSWMNVGTGVASQTFISHVSD
jgi:hypothetical protein